MWSLVGQGWFFRPPYVLAEMIYTESSPFILIFGSLGNNLVLQ